MTLKFVRSILSQATNTTSLGPPPLVTIWVWEFPPQSATLSLEAGRDDWLMEEIRSANVATQAVAEQWRRRQNSTAANGSFPTG